MGKPIKSLFNRRRSLFLFPCILGGIFLSLGGGLFLSAEPIILNPGDENASIQNDLFVDTAPPEIMVMGDFDGKGVDDIAISRREEREILLVLNPGPGTSVLSNAKTMKIIATAASADNSLLHVSHLAFANLNGDDKKDLVICVQAKGAAHEGQVDVVLGVSDPPTTLDLRLPQYDLRITGNAGDYLGTTLAVGDFVGNAVQDLFVGAAGTGGGYLLEGSSSLVKGLLDLKVTPLALPRIQGAGVGWESVKGDFDGNGKDDLALSVFDASVGGKINNGEIFLIYGRSVFPSPLSLAVSTNSVHIYGATPQLPTVFGIVAVRAEDLTGDGKSELLFGIDIPMNIYPETKKKVSRIFALNVAEAPKTGGVIDLSSPLVSTTPVVPYYYLGYTPGTVRMGDFDGDTKTDFVYRGDGSLEHSYNFCGRLSSIVGSGLDAFKNTGGNDYCSVQWNGYWTSLATGDVNKDGIEDLVAFEAVYPGYDPSSFNFLYGFRPLSNPRVHVRERNPQDIQVTLDLKVDGSPKEVYLSGDLAEEDRARWRPYVPEQRVSLSSQEGQKKVQAIFRNAFGRQSEVCSDTVFFKVEKNKTEPFSNLLLPGDHVVVNCSLSEPSHVKAEVYDREGTVLAVLLDEDRGPGVWPIVWDGKNAAGQNVAPGLFLIVVKVNGHADIHKILVQG